MKSLRQFFTASVLVFVLSLTTLAGEITTGVASPAPTPPSAPAQGEITTGLNGEITTGAPGDIHTTETSADATLAGAVVDLVQGVLALL